MPSRGTSTAACSSSAGTCSRYGARARASWNPPASGAGSGCGGRSTPASSCRWRSVGPLSERRAAPSPRKHNQWVRLILARSPQCSPRPRSRPPLPQRLDVRVTDPAALYSPGANTPIMPQLLTALIPGPDAPLALRLRPTDFWREGQVPGLSFTVSAGRWEFRFRRLSGRGVGTLRRPGLTRSGLPLTQPPATWP